MKCPNKAELVDCLLGKVPAARTEALLDHAGQCETCGNLMDDIDDTADGVVSSLRLDQKTDLSANAQIDRMIRRAEQLVPVNPNEPKPLEAKSHLLEGTRVRDYEIIKPIGEGGMGAVFLARHVRLKRDVAIKVLSLGRQRNAEAQQRFEQEMQIVGQLQHSGIVQALDAGEDHGVQYLVMEVIDGADLRRIVRLLGPLSLPDACEITYQAAVALKYAHSQKLIHRDIKPSNLMLSRDGVVKVMDLGIARFADQTHALTSTQQALGSLDFMAPEQLQAEAVDGMADVYALGCTLHFLLTGEPPEKRRTAALLVSRAPRLDALRHTLPPPLTNLMQHMLLPNPTERCDMANVSERLKSFIGSADLVQVANKSAALVRQEERGEKVSLTSEITTQPSIRRNRALWVAATVCATCLALSWWFFPRKNDTDDTAGLASLPSISSNVEPIREVPLFQVHSGAIRCATYCESTSQLIVGSDDSSISVRDLPNQKRICCLFANDAMIKQVVAAKEGSMFASLDGDGNIRAFSLPAVQLAWSRSERKGESRAVDLSVLDDELLIVLRADGNSFAVSLADGMSRTLPAQDKSKRIWRHREEKRIAGEQLRVAADTISVARSFGDKGWVVSGGRLARLIDSQSRDAKHFVYAEHAQPITSILTFDDATMVLTGDGEGQLRLWQAPDNRYSDMLLLCATKINSMEMTFELRQEHWTAEAFASSPDQVRMDDHADAMRLETTIERDGNEHTLQYKIID